MNPLSFLLFVYGIALFIKSTKRRNRYILTISIITSIVMFANAVFYRFFNDFITLPVLFQTSNFKDLSSSVTSNMNLTRYLFLYGCFNCLFSNSILSRKLREETAAMEKLHESFTLLWRLQL